MSIGYFTIVHILVLFLITMLSLLGIVISFIKSKQIFKSLVFANIISSVAIAIFLMFVLDKYTKKALLENVKSTRVLRNETMVFNGTVKNIGSFDLWKCKLIIKFANKRFSTSNIEEGTFFKSNGLNLFSWIFKENKQKKQNLENEILLFNKLRKNKSFNFSVAVNYPTNLNNFNIITKIKCY